MLHLLRGVLDGPHDDGVELIEGLEALHAPVRQLVGLPRQLARVALELHDPRRRGHEDLEGRQEIVSERERRRVSIEEAHRPATIPWVVRARSEAPKARRRRLAGCVRFSVVAGSRSCSSLVLPDRMRGAPGAASPFPVDRRAPGTATSHSTVTLPAHLDAFLPRGPAEYVLRTSVEVPARDARVCR